MNLRLGRYACEVQAPDNGWFGEAGEKATPFIRIPLVVTEGPFKDEEVIYQAWVSPTAVQRTIKNLKEVFEWDGDVIALARLMDTGPFVGKPCSIVVEEEEYNGKKRNVIKWLNGPNGAGTMMEVNKALQLASKIMGKPIDKSEQPPQRPRPGYGQAPQKPPPADPDFGIDENSESIPF